ncbi:MAG TPA: aldo/keto reductase [Thermotogota bacterium]|nr:aldo/keto reductase [Thermotogota bacterium]
MQLDHIDSAFKLKNGIDIPILGLGTYKAHGDELFSAILDAFKIGYRSIDTASFYENEEEVGEAIRASNIERKDIFVTTKVWNDEQGYDESLKAFDRSLGRLGLDYIDMYLIHWPVAGKFKQTWKALENLYEQGAVRAIGVCNFLEHQLHELMSSANVPPMVDQIEHHPELVQPSLREFLKENHIQQEAWSPIMKGGVMEIPQIVEIAEKHQKTPAQVVLRWDIQNGVVTIPKSVHKDRIKENSEIFDFELTEAEMKMIDNLDKAKRIGPDPKSFDF